jgi:hypothetical protein
MGFPFERLWADDPYRGAVASVGAFSFQQRPKGARMDRLPNSLAISIWTVAACWILAIIGYIFGTSGEWLLGLVALGILTGLAEWYLRRS